MEAHAGTIRTERTMPLPTALMQLLGSLATSLPAGSGGLPVRWIPDPRFPISSLETCNTLGRTRPVLGEDQAGLALSTETGQPLLMCTTVEEWLAGRDAGGMPYSMERTYASSRRCASSSP